MRNFGIHAALVSGALTVLVALVGVVQSGPAHTQSAQVITVLESVPVSSLTPRETTRSLPPVATYGDAPLEDTTLAASAILTVPYVFSDSDVSSDPSPTPTDIDACPFTADTYPYVLDFTKGGARSAEDLVLRADTTYADATHTLSISIPAGSYEVLTASLSHASENVGQGFHESWQLRFEDATREEIVTTHASRDLRDGESLVLERVEKEITLGESAAFATAEHAAYPARTAELVSPLCAALRTVTGASAETTYDMTASVIASNADATLPTSSQRSCPLLPREGRVLVDFTQGGHTPLDELVVSTQEDRITVYGDVGVPTGTYVVRLASFAPPERVTNGTDTWYVSLADRAGGVIATTPSSRTVPAWEPEFISKVSESFVVPQDATTLSAVHTAGSSDPVTVLCAAFDRIDGGQVMPSGSFTTTTIVRIPAPSEASSSGALPADTTLSYPPEKLGVPSALRDITIEQAVGEDRLPWVAALSDTPFQVLASSDTPARARLIEELFTGKTLGTTTPLVDAEAGVSLTRLSDETATATPTPEAYERARVAVNRLIERAGLLALRDTDGDGITDFDEEYLYGTNPDNPFSSESVLSDGERLLVGLDPSTDSESAVVVASPRFAGTEAPELFSVTSISFTDAPSASSTDTTVFSSTTTPRQIRVTGSAKPLSFVTLYMYSTPLIVTVRTDEDGNFSHTFDQGLEDGPHTLYLASLSGDGSILAKSAPVPFVQTSGGIEMTLHTVPTPVPALPLRDESGTMTLVLLALLFCTLAGMVLMGLHAAYVEQKEDAETREAEAHETP